MTSSKARETVLDFEEHVHYQTVAARLQKLGPMMTETSRMLRERLLWGGMRELAEEGLDLEDGSLRLSGGGGGDDEVVEEGSRDTGDGGGMSHESILPQALLDVLRRGPSLDTPAMTATLQSRTAQLHTVALSEYDDLVQFKGHASSLFVGGETLCQAIENAACSPHGRLDKLLTLFFPHAEHEAEAREVREAGGCVLEADARRRLAEKAEEEKALAELEQWGEKGEGEDTFFSVGNTSTGAYRFPRTTIPLVEDDDGEGVLDPDAQLVGGMW